VNFEHGKHKENYTDILHNQFSFFLTKRKNRKTLNHLRRDAHLLQNNRDKKMPDTKVSEPEQ
jgi:hypothetical protein